MKNPNDAYDGMTIKQPGSVYQAIDGSFAVVKHLTATHTKRSSMEFRWTNNVHEATTHVTPAALKALRISKSGNLINVIVEKQVTLIKKDGSHYE